MPEPQGGRATSERDATVVSVVRFTTFLEKKARTSFFSPVARCAGRDGATEPHELLVRAALVVFGLVKPNPYWNNVCLWLDRLWRRCRRRRSLELAHPPATLGTASTPIRAQNSASAKTEGVRGNMASPLTQCMPHIVYWTPTPTLTHPTVLTTQRLSIIIIDTCTPPATRPYSRPNVCR